jgi:hypothetical protein
MSCHVSGIAAGVSMLARPDDARPGHGQVRRLERSSLPRSTAPVSGVFQERVHDWADAPIFSE